MVLHSGFFYLYLELLDPLFRLLAFGTSGTLKSLAPSNSSVLLQTLLSIPSKKTLESVNPGTEA